MDDAVIISACRTPIGKLLGALSGQSAPQLGALAVGEAMKRGRIPKEDVYEVIMGNVLTAGLGQAPARQAALGAGLPPTVAALTVNMVCGSGLRAAMLASQAVRAGDADVIVAGGQESMSRAPHLVSGGRGGWKFGDQTMVDSMLHDGLFCAFEKVPMGTHADYTAKTDRVTRRDQDEFACQSQQRAIAATKAGAFAQEIVPVTVAPNKPPVAVDEGPRPDTTIEGLAKLKPAFGADGSVTAGNSSLISDGAAAVVVASRAYAMKHGHKPMVRIVASAIGGVAPRDLFIAPVFAIQNVLARAGMKLSDIDLFELNEAFAAQVVACVRRLGLPNDRLNVNGGAIAIGHPIGASGARVLVTLLYAMQQHGAKRGLASACLGGGNAVAMIVEREN